MSVVIPADITDAFDHLFVLGLASIVEADTARSVRIHWRSRREVVFDAGPSIAEDDLGQIVRRHAESQSESLWLRTVSDLAGGRRSPMSPRIGRLPDARAFQQLEQSRMPLIDRIASNDWLTHRFIGSLGRPIDWAVNDKLETVPDRGASAWEMKTRNSGEEFVHNRLSKLCDAVVHRSAERVADGIFGRILEDECGKNALDSRTPTGLRTPGPADNARAWAALWGISAFPVQPVTGQRDSARQSSTTAGALRLSGGRVWFFVPVPDSARTLASLRSIIRSAPLARQALLTVKSGEPADRGRTARDFEWLEEHGIKRFALFERAKSDNANAPELFTLPGRILDTTRVPSTPAIRRRQTSGSVSTNRISKSPNAFVI